MKQHKLKTWPEYFEAVFNHKKDFEIRRNDRDFQERDELILQEWDNETQLYTGREIKVYVSYILHGRVFGLMDGFVCMNIKSY